MSDDPRLIGFLLVPGFALMSYASTIEPLRAANLLSGRHLYDWRHVSVDGADMAASTGVAFRPDHRVGDGAAFDTLFVCAGGNRVEFDHGPTLAWLRGLARQGTRIGGVSGGPLVMARAGLLDGYRCTVHWEHAPAFAEEFPGLVQTGSLFEIDRGRLTCAGGIAALDMVHALIEADHGAALATAVNDWFLQTQVRMSDTAQRMPPPRRLGIMNRHLSLVLEAMEAAIEEPLGRDDLARLAGISTRQLERLFKGHLGTSVERHYLALRLDRARSLLRQTPMQVAEVAVACGFVSPAHFSRAYRARFGRAPSGERAG